MLTALVVSALSASAQAMNIYKEGSQGSLLYNRVSTILDDITPVFLDARDTSKYLKNVHSGKLAESSVSHDDINAFISMIPDGLSQYKNTGLIAFVISGYSVMDGDIGSTVCAIVFISDRGLEYDTLIHEASHCKANKYHFDTEFKSLLLKAYKPIKQVVDLERFIQYYHEALAVHLEVSHASRDGRIDELKHIIKMNHRKGNNGSIGFRTTRHALKMCSGNNCPTDVIQMAEKMVHSPGFIEDFYQDINDMEGST